MRRFLQGVLALFHVDWNAFIAADMEEESQMVYEPWTVVGGNPAKVIKRRELK